MSAPRPLAAGSVSLRMYPHALPASQIVAEMRAQAATAERAGFDGVMTSEHHGGFPGYLPNPLQAAGWLLEATEALWAAPCPLLLPLRHWSQVAEDLAWMSARFPGRVGAGFACGGLAQDFEMADLPYEENLARFKMTLPRIVEALRGKGSAPLASDAAIAACAEAPISMLSAAQSPAAVRRAADLGIGLLYDSLQTLERTRQLSNAYREAGGTGVQIAIRRVWLGPAPTERAQAQMEFYRSYAKNEAQQHWGTGEELIAAATGPELAERLADFCARSACDALNLRLHLTGLEPAAVREQIQMLGAEVLPELKRSLEAEAIRTGSA
jgi:alkanesulfonate monooxygenase SsuD/methylene tetrahydromethanopterin reductase-like flavin-dependent oxidoreductase (luciferase family)